MIAEDIDQQLILAGRLLSFCSRLRETALDPRAVKWEERGVVVRRVAALFRKRSAVELDTSDAQR